MNLRDDKYCPRSQLDDTRDFHRSYASRTYNSREYADGGWEYRDSPEMNFSTEAYRDLGIDPVCEREPLRGGDPMEAGSTSLIVDQDIDVDFDGEPVELSEDDQELARKKKELQLIEQQIIQKKASIAMKQVAPILKTMEIEKMKKRKFAEVKNDLEQHQTTKYVKDVSFKDRIHGILQKREKPQENPPKASAKPAIGSLNQPKALFQPPKVAKSFVEKMNASILRNEGSVKDSPPKNHEEEHPLKLRVKDLMERRLNPGGALPSSREVLKVEPGPPIQNPVHPDPEQGPAARGFQRFLNILNKGVDMNLLSKIVNGIPSEDEVLLHGPPQSQIPGSHSGAPRRDHSRSLSGEGRTGGILGDSHTHSLLRPKSPLRIEVMDSRPDCPPVEAKKEVNPEDERKYGQMHDLLQTIGLDLGVEEVGQLSNRIQERLYGKKGHKETERERRDGERKRRDRERQKESEQKGHHSSLSSDSTSPSPRPHLRSPRKASRDSRGDVRHRNSMDRDWDRGLEESKEPSIPALAYTIPTHHIPFPPPASVDVTSTYTPPPPPQYMAPNVCHYPSAMPPAWGYAPGPTPFSLYSQTYPQQYPTTPYYFDGPSAAFSQSQASYQTPGYPLHPDTGFQGPSQVCVNQKVLSRPRCLLSVPAALLPNTKQKKKKKKKKIKAKVLNV